LWHSEAFQFHPLVNTSTLVISRENLKRFIAKTEHDVRLLDIPSQE
jgi:Ala-tRNA(Pro) deacylase